MANELRPHYQSGKALYAVLIRAADGLVWNGTGWESLAAANWGTYAVTLTEQSTTGFYYGSMPAAQAAGLYDVNYFLRAGGSPATGDTLVSQQSIDWSGVADAAVSSRATPADVRAAVSAATSAGVISATGLGNRPLTLGSLYKWQLTVTKDGAVWDLSAATVTFWWKRPNGSKFSQVAAGDSSGVCTYQDVASQLDATGNTWTFSAQVAGYGWTVPVTFGVVGSP